MSTMPVLIRRELWEHRALWIAPLIVAAIVLLLALAGRPTVNVSPEALERAIDPQERLALFAVVHVSLPLFFYAVAVIVLFFYLLDCLYAERRDRSILFWKSLPVSDAATVLAKLLVALAVVPLGVFVVAALTDLAASGLLWLRMGDTPLGDAVLTWSTPLWLRIQGLVLLTLLLAALWYAPIAAYLLLVSAWARRNVFLWAVLPPVILLLVEGLAFHTGYVRSLLGHRLVGLWRSLEVDFHRITGEVTPSAALFEAVNVAPAFVRPDLWLGVAVAALLVFGAIRLRRHQDVV